MVGSVSRLRGDAAWAASGTCPFSRAELDISSRRADLEQASDENSGNTTIREATSAVDAMKIAKLRAKAMSTQLPRSDAGYTQVAAGTETVLKIPPRQVQPTLVT